MCSVVGHMMGMARRLLLGEGSLVWWLHVSGARWARNYEVPVGQGPSARLGCLYYRRGVCRAGLWAG